MRDWRERNLDKVRLPTPSKDERRVILARRRRYLVTLGFDTEFNDAALVRCYRCHKDWAVDGHLCFTCIREMQGIIEKEKHILEDQRFGAASILAMKRTMNRRAYEEELAYA